MLIAEGWAGDDGKNGHTRRLVRGGLQEGRLVAYRISHARRTCVQGNLLLPAGGPRSPARNPPSPLWRGLYYPRRSASSARAGRAFRAERLAAGCAATFAPGRRGGRGSRAAGAGDSRRVALAIFGRRRR